MDASHSLRRGRFGMIHCISLALLLFELSDVSHSFSFGNLVFPREKGLNGRFSFVFPLLSRRSSSPQPLFATPVSNDDPSPTQPPLVLHHAALKTRNITTAIQFYSLLDYKVTCKFRAGPARAAWLELDQSPSARLEIIEVPGYMLNEEEGTRRRSIDLMSRQDLLGYNHVALDVTAQIKSQNLTSLGEWMDLLNQRSTKQFKKFLRVALEPRQQTIGRLVYELAFIYDADGCLVELLHEQSELSQNLESGWEPWDGAGFIGAQSKEDGTD